MKNIKWLDTFVLLGFLLAIASPLGAATYVWDLFPDPGYQTDSGYWDATSPNWNMDGTETTQVPWVDGNDAVFSASGTSWISNDAVTASSITFNGTGYTLYGNTLTNTGDYVMNQDATIGSALGGQLAVRGPATLTISGGLNTSSRIIIAHGDGAQGKVVQQGGDVLVNEYMMVGGNYNAGASGTYTINDGTLDYGWGMYLGWGFSNSVGTFVQNGGTVTSSTATQGILLGVQGGVGNYYLNSGTLQSYMLDLDNDLLRPAQQNFYFGGGTFQAIINFSTWTGLNTTIQSGATAAIDTNGFNVAWLGVVSGAGDMGLSKQGVGKLTLGPANSYTGKTDVYNGYIIVTGNSSLGTGHVTTYWDLANPLGPMGGGVDLNGCTLANNFTLHGAGSVYSAEGAIFNTSAAPAEITGSVEFGTEGEYIGGETTQGDIKLSGLITGGVDSSLGGIYAIFKNGKKTLTLSRPDNTFDGFIYIEQGVLEVTKLANKNEPSSLGMPTNDASNVLKFSNYNGYYDVPGHEAGQTLRYIGDKASSTDRAIVLSFGATSDNIIDASGTTLESTVSFTGNAVFTPNEKVAITTLTLTGENLGDNTFAGDIIGPVSLVKSGPGKWILSGDKSYMGDTTVLDGTLVAGNLVNSPNVTVLGGVLSAQSIVANTLTIGATGAVAVPEPSTIALLIAGAFGLLWVRRLRRD